MGERRRGYHFDKIPEKYKQAEGAPPSVFEGGSWGGVGVLDARKG